MKKNKRKCDLIHKITVLEDSHIKPHLLSTNFLIIIFILSIISGMRQTTSCHSQFVLNSINIYHAEFVAISFINKRLIFYHKISPRYLQLLSKVMQMYLENEDESITSGNRDS